MAMIASPDATGLATSADATRILRSLLVEACFGSDNRSTTFSTTTTAPSTRMPTAIASPPRLIRLAVRPIAFMKMKVSSTAIGSASATITDARTSPRNNSSRITTSTVASSSAVSTVPTALPIRSDRS